MRAWLTARRSVILSGAVALTLLGTVLYLEGLRPARESAAADAAANLYPEEGNIEALRVETRDGSFALHQTDGVWELLGRDGVPRAVDTHAVSNVLSALRLSRARPTMEGLGGIKGPKDEVSLTELGLETPLVTLSWSAGEESLRLALGRPLSFEPHRIHGLKDGRIVSLPLSLLTCVSAWSELNFRYRTLLPLAVNEITGLDVVRRRGHAAGELSRVRFHRDRHVLGHRDSWRMTHPHDERAAPGVLAALCSQLAGLEAQAFGPDQPTEEQLQERGLSPAAIELHLTREGAARGTLLLGGLDEDSGLVWAYTGKGPLTAVRPALARNLTRSLESLRDRRGLLPLRVESLRRVRFEMESAAPTTLSLHCDSDSRWHVSGSEEDRSHGLILGLFEAMDEVRLREEDPEPFQHELGPGSVRVSLEGLDPAGSPVEIAVQVSGTVSIEGSTARVAVRITDRAGRSNAGAVDALALQEVMDRVRGLVALRGEGA